MNADVKKRVEQKQQRAAALNEECTFKPHVNERSAHIVWARNQRDDVSGPPC